MQILVVIGHQHQGSFNHAIAAAAVEELKAAGHRVIFHDLYEENFDPILTQEECAKDAVLPAEIEGQIVELLESDGYIIVHPNWWGQPPAILKGWVDRVIRPGVAYEFLEGDSGEGVPNGLLKAGAAIVFNTSNTEMERERRTFGDPLETIWKNCIFGLCGVRNFHRRMFGIIVTSTEDQRKMWLDTVRKDVDTFF